MAARILEGILDDDPSISYLFITLAAGEDRHIEPRGIETYGTNRPVHAGTYHK